MRQTHINISYALTKPCGYENYQETRLASLQAEGDVLRVMCFSAFEGAQTQRSTEFLTAYCVYTSVPPA